MDCSSSDVEADRVVVSENKHQRATTHRQNAGSVRFFSVLNFVLSVCSLSLLRNRVELCGASTITITVLLNRTQFTVCFRHHLIHCSTASSSATQGCKINPQSDSGFTFCHLSSEPTAVFCLTFKWYLGIFVQVFLQFLIVHVLLNSKRGRNGRIDPAEVQPGSSCVALTSCPCSWGKYSAPGAQSSPSSDALHGEADGVTELGVCAAAGNEDS